MPSTTAENHYYEDLANYFAGEAIILKCIASVHVEDFEDAVFWEKILNNYSKGEKFNFIYHSLTPSGSDATGVSHCLKFKDYLSNRFFICIDSDYRYLLQEANINSAKFIFQTYTYSNENHLCYSKKLNFLSRKCNGLPNKIFDFELFLRSYSQTVYDAFIWHLYFEKLGNDTAFSKEEFNRMINLLQSVPNYDIEKNANAVILELQNRCNTKVTSLVAQFSTVDIEPVKASLLKLGLSPDNAYLYVRGHNLYDLICRIGDQVNVKILEVEKQNLTGNAAAIKKIYQNNTTFKHEIDKQIMFDEYPEIEKIGRDVSSIFG